MNVEFKIYQSKSKWHWTLKHKETDEIIGKSHEGFSYHWEVLSNIEAITEDFLIILKKLDEKPLDKKGNKDLKVIIPK